MTRRHNVTMLLLLTVRQGLCILAALIVPSEGIPDLLVACDGVGCTASAVLLCRIHSLLEQCFHLHRQQYHLMVAPKKNAINSARHMCTDVQLCEYAQKVNHGPAYILMLVRQVTEMISRSMSKTSYQHQHSVIRLNPDKHPP